MSRGLLVVLAILLLIVGLLAAIALPGLIETRVGANESAAVSTLRTVHTVQGLYRNGSPDSRSEVLPARGVFASTFADLHAAAAMLDGYAKGAGPMTKQGYVFTLRTSEDGQRYEVRAHPVRRGETGDRSFFVNETGTIRQGNSDAIGPHSPAVR